MRLRWLMVVMVVGAVAGCGAGDAGTGVAAPTPSAAPTTVSPAPTCASGEWSCGWQQRFQAASALIDRQRGHVGIVVRDRRTSAVWSAGEPTLPIWAGSTPKLAVAVDLLERARTGEITLDAKARSQLDAMLAVSDNSAADALWHRYINAGRFMQRIRTGYGMVGATYVDGFPSRWGFIKCTATDLGALMSYLLDRLNVADRDYLVRAMRGVGPIQRWGVWSAGAALQPGVKNGWSQEIDAGTTHWITATVGFAGPEERYVVAAMYHQLPGGDTLEHGVQVLSDLVATVFGAPVPAVVVVPDNQ